MNSNAAPGPNTQPEFPASASENHHTAPDAVVGARFERSMTVPEAFFASEAERIAQACWAMARRFHEGGRLLAFGNGASVTDAQHVSVEFVHPVIVGKRALPALALTNDSAAMSRLPGAVGLPSESSGAPFARQLTTLARPNDIALGFSIAGNDANVLEALKVARSMGLLTVCLAGGDGGAIVQFNLDYCFVVPTSDALAIQETHETLYHVLWELVHVLLEHEGLMA